MNLNHLLVQGIQTEREAEIARHQLVVASPALTPKSGSTPSIAKPERWLDRLLPAR